MTLPRGYVVAPVEAVELLEKPLSDLMPWDMSTLRALQKVATQQDGTWILKVGVRRAKAMSSEVSQ